MHVSNFLIPQEITDYIIDHFHDDPPTLAICALVCRAWYPASRHHLFAVVNISPRSIATFSDLLLQAPSGWFSIVPILRELSLHLHDDALWLGTLSGLFPECTSLRSLKIFFRGGQLTEEVRQTLSTTFHTITYLALLETTPQRRSLSRDVEWICTFPHLRKVLISGDYYKDLDISPYARLPSGVQELKLDLPSPATQAFVQWLLHHTTIPTVSSLLLFRVVDDDVSILKEYLAECRNVLKNLMLFLYQCRDRAGDFDLSQHVVLNSIYLSSNGSSSVRTIRDILSTSASLIEMQDVLLRISSFELADLYDWASLDRVFTSHRSSSAKITIVMDEDGRYESDLATRLPMCAKRKQLHFVRAGVHSAASSYVEEVFGYATHHY
ncbi:hypothetical protein VNI00_007965 [Paramarasmius palmivorus]|uniref:F-box domain-containing protein n=1 Tax=Paramarasmius palmivorus TaxID=297713 RepID=A0AAW0CZ55_9AGAR